MSENQELCFYGFIATSLVVNNVYLLMIFLSEWNEFITCLDAGNTNLARLYTTRFKADVINATPYLSCYY